MLFEFAFDGEVCVVFANHSIIIFLTMQLLFNGGFGEDGRGFSFDDDELMPTVNLGGFENMDDIICASQLAKICDAPGLQLENATDLLVNLSLSSYPTSVVAPKNKSSTKRRQMTLLMDEEMIIPGRIMKERISK